MATDKPNSTLFAPLSKKKSEKVRLEVDQKSGPFAKSELEKVPQPIIHCRKFRGRSFCWQGESTADKLDISTVWIINYVLQILEHVYTMRRGPYKTKSAPYEYGPSD